VLESGGDVPADVAGLRNDLEASQQHASQAKSILDGFGAAAKPAKALYEKASEEERQLEGMLAAAIEYEAARAKWKRRQEEWAPGGTGCDSALSTTEKFSLSSPYYGPDPRVPPPHSFGKSM
jgi:hypothetical protein